MLKSLFISIWAIIVTIGVVFAQSLLTGGSDADGPAQPAMLDHRTDTISTAMFNQGKVIGHFTTRIHYKMPKHAMPVTDVTMEQIVTDGLFELIFKEPPGELAKLRDPELELMGSRLVELLNNRNTPISVKNVRFENTRLMLK